MITLRTDTRPLLKALDRYMEGSRRPRETVMKIQAKGILKTAISITPPSDGKTTGTEAKKKGESTIEADLHRIFSPMTAKQIEGEIWGMGGRELSAPFHHKGAAPIGLVTSKVLTLSQMAAWHQARRLQNGRVMNVHSGVTTGLRKRDMKGLGTGIVSRADFSAYLKIVQAKVGYLVSGWASTAHALGVTMPGWMTRNHAPGSVEIRSNSRGISIRSTNAAPFSGNVKGLERRLQFAVDAQAEKIERQLQHHEEQLQKSAGLRH